MKDIEDIIINHIYELMQDGYKTFDEVITIDDTTYVYVKGTCQLYGDYDENHQWFVNDVYINIEQCDIKTYDWEDNEIPNQQKLNIDYIERELRNIA